MKPFATLCPTLALILTLAITPIAQAQPFGYTESIAPALFQINLATGQQTLVGGLTAIFSLAANYNNQLFGLQSGGNFVSINPANGMSMFISSTPLGNPGGLNFRPDGTLLGANNRGPGVGPAIFSINPSNGNSSLVTNVPTPIGQILALTTKDNTTAYLLNSTDQLYTVPLTGPNAGMPSLLSTLTDNVNAIDFGPNGILYGVDFAGQEGTIDPNTGLFTPVGIPSGHETLALTIPLQAEPVVSTIPEPTSLSILAAGLGIAAWWRRRRAGRVA